jgi:hypothetical protein
VAFAREVLDRYSEQSDFGFSAYPAPNQSVEVFSFSMKPVIKEEIRSLAVKFRGVRIWPD